MNITLQTASMLDFINLQRSSYPESYPVKRYS